MTLSLVNLTPNTLFFSYAPGIDPKFVIFAVEYKATSLNSGWVQLLPEVKPVVSAKSPFPNLITEEITQKVGISILSGQEKHLSFPPDFPMSKMGFYRITAVMTVPEASEYNGEISPSTKVRSFNLVAHSQPIILRHTANGFTLFNATASKSASPE